MGEYKVAAGGDATPGAWTLEGADASSFTLTGSGTTRMLEFRSSPDYDAMADADGDNMYEVTIKVTDSINSDTYDTFAVDGDSDQRGRTRCAERIDDKCQRQRGRHGCPGHLHAHGDRGWPHGHLERGRY